MDIPDNIIKECIEGSRSGQEELYRLVAPKMYGVCLQYAGNADAKMIPVSFLRGSGNAQPFVISFP